MPRNTVDYQEDFYAWTVEQVRLLRSGELSAIDVANIAEEIESMGRSDRRELKSRCVLLVMHLLKWRRQPAARSIARARAIPETGLADDAFPEACPFTPDEVLSRAFLPER